MLGTAGFRQLTALRLAQPARAAIRQARFVAPLAKLVAESRRGEWYSKTSRQVSEVRYRRLRQDRGKAIMYRNIERHPCGSPGSLRTHRDYPTARMLRPHPNDVTATLRHISSNTIPKRACEPIGCVASYCAISASVQLWNPVVLGGFSRSIPAV